MGESVARKYRKPWGLCLLMPSGTARRCCKAISEREISRLDRLADLEESRVWRNHFSEMRGCSF
jgi:hypothetical protein